MRRSNRKKRNAPENHERWLITYSDLITLLLIFFIVMYSMSKVDMAKYEMLSESLHLQFAKGDTIIEKHDGPAGDLKQGDKATPVPTDTPTPSPSASAQAERERELQDLLSKVNQYIEENNLQAQVSTGDLQRGVVIKLNDMVLFDLGKADLKPASLPILDKLGSLFRSLDTKISIEGHTDNLPLQTGSLYKDNLGLSQARSVSVIRYLLSTPGMNDRMFVSTAYGDTMPIAPNDTEENRAKNRRVEIVVLREPQKLN
ncbi:flagellar motor protein MotB [Paenibacillus mesotrionivorans]|uniref:Flagellar motor protein MotB n=1 Tax=Paenibacillus mesotrionivorans TaxID=3160968 RepID=A0ACC7P5L3_9BACL